MIHAWKINPRSYTNQKQAHSIYRSAGEIKKDAFKFGRIIIEKMLSGYHVYFSPNPRHSKLSRSARLLVVEEKVTLQALQR